MKIALLGLQEFKSEESLDTNFKHLQELIRRLADRGHEITLFGNAHEQHLFHHPRIEYVVVPSTLNTVRLSIFYARHIRSVDVIHVLSLRHAWVLPLLATFFKNTPRVIDIRQFSFAKSAEGKAQAQNLVSMVKTHADQIIVPFASVKRYIFANQGRFTHAVHDGIEFEAIREPKRTTLPRGLAQRDYIVMDVENGVNTKLMIQALAKQSLQLPVICLGQDISEEVRELISSTPHFYLVSPTRESEIDAMIAHAKLYIHTQKNPESIRLVKKALVFGTPLVAPETLTLRELYGRDYLAYTSGNLSSILNITYFARQESALMVRMADRALMKAKEELTLEGNVNRMIYIWANAYRAKELQNSSQAVDVLSRI
jgi:hypothetical protein